jgi:hypothetical protein
MVVQDIIKAGNSFAVLIQDIKSFSAKISASPAESGGDSEA